MGVVEVSLILRAVIPCDSWDWANIDLPVVLFCALVLWRNFAFKAMSQIAGLAGIIILDSMATTIIAIFKLVILNFSHWK